MADWIKHQLAVWRYGVQLLFVLALFAVAWSIIGGLLWLAITEALGLELSPLGWLACSVAVAPFNLPAIARSFGEIVKRDPPPNAADLYRRQMERRNRA